MVRRRSGLCEQERNYATIGKGSRLINTPQHRCSAHHVVREKERGAGDPTPGGWLQGSCTSRRRIVRRFFLEPVAYGGSFLPLALRGGC